ncbi:beta-1,3-galactosyltransferase 5-like [Actinia tenebrosa]|uniref:Hexosyltransferase n=1 Tax=Actinia tenebrosa TaxID=6105 RepID=A0A6P8IC24_ACTTE|nr:beta-1,3-galactosyltransferase 5-like [Actinia tenebrosa]
MANEPQRKEKIAKQFKEDILSAECLTPPFLLIEIHSHPKNFLSRQAIRLSWGNKDLDEKRNYKIIFLLGKVKNQTIQQMVQMEARRTGDIVQGDFLDIYNNLYKKMVLSLKWPLKNCRAKYILKTDEDCYVNTDMLISFLEKYDTTRGSNPLYMGRKSDNSSVERDPEDRYYVSKDIYPSPTYDPYISGGGYVFSGFLLEKLYEASRFFLFFL